MEIVGMWILIAGSMAVAWWTIKHTNNEHYESGYWTGRNEGWRASLEHQERGSVYGHPYYNHKRIAGLWSAYLDYPITPHQAALCMALVKVSRLTETPDHYDSVKDFIAYGSIYRTVLEAEQDSDFDWRE